MRVKEIMDSTSDSRLYRICMRRYEMAITGQCDRCRKGHGCNRRRTNNNWKEHRRTQYKVGE